MALTKIYLLPLSLFVLIPATFLITYAIAVYLHHVEIEFPYISDTGTWIPESCIFGELLTIVSFILIATVYVRFKQVEQYHRDHLSAESSKVLKLNIASLWIGWISVLGVTLVANFQETSVIAVHFVGSFIAFGCGMIYMWLQTIISYYAHPLLNTITIARIRLALTISVTLCFITSVFTGIMAMKYFHGKDTTKWYPKDGGYKYHVISTATEWLLVMGFDFLFLTFVREMRYIFFSSPQVSFLVELDLPTNDIYNNDDQDVTQSQNNFHSSVVNIQTISTIGRENMLTTQAAIH